VPFATRRTNLQIPAVGVAVHNGRELRTEVAANMVLDEATRLREEDPHTGLLAARLPNSIVVERSRFEVDLNRPADEAVYMGPDDAWGLQLWEVEPGAGMVSDSLDLYDNFYSTLGELLDTLVIRHGGFVLYDVHSYNHRRDGAGAVPAPQEENPDLNLGTGSLPPKWKAVAEVFLDVAREAGLDARENVKFEGRQVAAWVHENFGDVGCALAIEFKKSFMDEWSDELFAEEFERRGAFLESSVDPVLATWRVDVGQ
jgi:N-formylglutamate amidohydrolase